MKKLFATVLVVAISTQLFGCTKAKRNAKHSIADTNAFVRYLEKEIGAVKADSDSIDIDMLRKGVYIENDKNFRLSNVVIKDDILQEPIGNHWDFVADIPEFYWARGSASFRGIKDYDLDDCICYVKCSLDSEEIGVNTGTKNGHDYSVHTYDDKVSATCISYYYFSEKDDALECFKTIVDKVFEEKKIAAYSELLKTISGMSCKELYDGVFTSKTIDMANYLHLIFSPTTMDPDAKINKRNSYNLEDLPKDVYELDGKNRTGHLTYNCAENWCELDDLWKATNEEPGYITVKEESKHVTVELNDNVLIIAASIDGYKQGGCPNINYDEWPNVQFDDNKIICSVCDDFGLNNPYKVSLNEDQNDQFFYLTGYIPSNGKLVCSELYKRKN